MAENAGGAAPVTHSRQVTIDALCEHFANDVMSVDEFERRVDLAHSASSIDELKELLRDLPGGDLPAVAQQAPVPVPKPSPIAAAHTKENELVVAVLGGSSRKGAWRPARRNTAVAVMGGAELDFREALLPPGVTELRIFTCCGGVEVIVPPDLRVESNGIAIMGGFEHGGNEHQPTDMNAPTLKISGAAIMGGVDITVRLSGETARDARRRRKLERKERRRLGRGG